MHQHLHLTPGLLDSEAATPLPSRPRASGILALDEICFSGDGRRTNWAYLSAPKNLSESWFTFPGTKIFLICFVRTVSPNHVIPENIENNVRLNGDSDVTKHTS